MSYELFQTLMLTMNLAEKQVGQEYNTVQKTRDIYCRFCGDYKLTLIVNQPAVTGKVY